MFQTVVLSDACFSLLDGEMKRILPFYYLLTKVYITTNKFYYQQLAGKVLHADCCMDAVSVGNILPGNDTSRHVAYHDDARLTQSWRLAVDVYRTIAI